VSPKWRAKTKTLEQLLIHTLKSWRIINKNWILGMAWILLNIFNYATGMKIFWPKFETITKLHKIKISKYQITKEFNFQYVNCIDH